MIEKNYTTKDVADILACSVRTVYRMIKSGELGPITRRVSGVILIPESTINCYLEQLRCES